MTSSRAPDPPDWLHGAPGRAAFVNAYQACVRRGQWDPGFTSALGILASVAGLYVALVREVAELAPETVSDDLAACVIEQRRAVREWMIEFLLLAPDAVDGGTLRPDGLDSDIARLCDMVAVQ